MNEEQYINPIIQAMVQSQRNVQERERLKAEIENQKAQHGLASQAQTLAEKKLQEETDYHHQLAEHAAEVLKVSKTQQMLENLGALRNLRAGGADLLKIFPQGGQIPGGQPNGVNEQGQPSGPIQIPGAPPNQPIAYGGGTPRTINVPGLGEIDPSGFAGPEQLLQQEMAKAKGVAGATAQGTAEAQAPFVAQAREFELKKEREKLQQEFTNKLAESAQQGKQLADVARIHGGYQQSVAAIEGINHLRGIMMSHQLGLGDQAQFGKQILDGIFNGSTDFTKLTQDEKRAVNAYAAGTGELSSMPTNGADYSKKLTSISGLQQLIQKARDLAANYSVDSPNSTGKGNQNFKLPVVGTVGRVEPGSDLDSQLKSLKSQGGELASFFDQQNRKSDAEILRQTEGLFDPKATREQNLQKINDKVNRLNQGVKSVFSGMPAERINTILGNRGVTEFGGFQPDPEWLKNAPPTSVKGGKLDRDTSLKVGQPVYK